MIYEQYNKYKQLKLINTNGEIQLPVNRTTKKPPRDPENGLCNFICSPVLRKVKAAYKVVLLSSYPLASR